MEMETKNQRNPKHFNFILTILVLYSIGCLSIGNNCDIEQSKYFVGLGNSSMDEGNFEMAIKYYDDAINKC